MYVIFEYRGFEGVGVGVCGVGRVRGGLRVVEGSGWVGEGVGGWGWVFW